MSDAEETPIVCIQCKTRLAHASAAKCPNCGRTFSSSQRSASETRIARVRSLAEAGDLLCDRLRAVRLQIADAFVAEGRPLIATLREIEGGAVVGEVIEERARQALFEWQERANAWINSTRR